MTQRLHERRVHSAHRRRPAQACLRSRDLGQILRILLTLPTKVLERLSAYARANRVDLFTAGMIALYGGGIRGLRVESEDE